MYSSYKMNQTHNISILMRLKKSKHANPTPTQAHSSLNSVFFMKICIYSRARPYGSMCRAWEGARCVPYTKTWLCAKGNPAKIIFGHSHKGMSVTIIVQYRYTSFTATYTLFSHTRIALRSARSQGLYYQKVSPQFERHTRLKTFHGSM